MQKNNAQGKGNKVVATQEVNQGIANKLASGKTIKVCTYGVTAEITAYNITEIISSYNILGEEHRCGYALECSVKMEYAGDIIEMIALFKLFNWDNWSVELRKQILGLAIAETILGEMYYEFIPNYRYKYYYPEEGNYKVVSKTKKVA